ncbi:MAG: DUF4160 domain-containing protein [bacterium]|nr:DUF4160 domain-containing protein [bacterium]
MAKIFRVEQGDAMDVYIYSRKEHPPAHCHVFYENEEAIIFLNPVAVRKVSPNLNDWEVENIITFIQEHQEFLIGEWIKVTGLPLE